VTSSWSFIRQLL